MHEICTIHAPFIFHQLYKAKAKAKAANRPPMEAALATAPLELVMLEEEEVEPAADDAVLVEPAAAVVRVALVPRTVLLPPTLEVAIAKPEDAVPEAPTPDPADPDDPPGPAAAPEDPEDPELVEFPEEAGLDPEEPEEEPDEPEEDPDEPEEVPEEAEADPVAVLEAAAEEDEEDTLVELVQLRS